ncbi:MAG: hypothetical protein LBK42_03155 [Propionibacteriaceae bacterium]|jgi:hypothetical protein|nr:hypothetical protein [Propionibacteriaceae bacterium]
MSWSAGEIAALLQNLRRRGGDSTLVEVKTAAGGPPRLAESLCAFGNAGRVTVEGGRGNRLTVYRLAPSPTPQALV